MRSVLEWVHEVLGMRNLLKRNQEKVNVKDGTKNLKQYKWRCTFRDAYYVCKLIWPWAHTKLPKIKQIHEEHYADSDKIMNGKIVNLEEYRKAMNLE